MHKQIGFTDRLFLFFQIVYLISSSNVAFAGGNREISNPFTPKALLSRYWNSHILSNSLGASFLLSKASPMNAVESATYTKLAEENALSTKLESFCSSAKLLCFPDLSQSLEKHDTDAHFNVYANQNFTNYGTGRIGTGDSFMNYSNGVNIPVDSFRRYGRDSIDRTEGFNTYAQDGNVVDQRFNSYGVKGTGGSGEFESYAGDVNVPHLTFSTYSTEGNDQKSSFTTYTEEANSGEQSFASYGKDGNGNPLSFTSYGKSSNVMGSEFTSYGEFANSGHESFTSYGSVGNVPKNTFKAYDEERNGGTLSFTSYRDQANVGDDSFQSYAKKSNSAYVDFSNYGQSFNEGTDKFSGYGEGSANQKELGFKVYGKNTTFKTYNDKNRTSFAGYTNNAEANTSGKPVNKWVEPGKFFRESTLKKGTIMQMPDISDKMFPRSFLPRSIWSKLPISTSKLDALKSIFRAADNSSMTAMISDALIECERAPSRGETKRCVGSAEDMIDFATSILGRNVVVKTTENVEGSKHQVKIGTVKRINGGNDTDSVSCHQSLFPCLLYFCHHVPNVRVYEADILDPNTEKKINRAAAICHMDTSSWSPTHGAFLALGSRPGRIEVCHLIFENDMMWTRADD